MIDLMHPTVVTEFRYYYLHSKMIVHFLEFDIFWEKFVYALVAQIALSRETVHFTKKNLSKVLKIMKK